MCDSFQGEVRVFVGYNADTALLYYKTLDL